MMQRRAPFCFLLNTILKPNKICIHQGVKIQTIKPLPHISYTCCPSFGLSTKIDDKEIRDVKVPKTSSRKTKKKDSKVEHAVQTDDSNVLTKSIDSDNGNEIYEGNNIGDENKESPEKSLSKKIKIFHLDGRTYGLIMKRVMNTCKIYLDSTQEQQAKVDINSRFYYVKNSLDALGTMDREAFREYLNQTEIFYHPTKQRQIKYQPKNSEKTDSSNTTDSSTDLNTEKNKQEKTYTFQSPYCTKKDVVKYLETPENGPLLKELIIGFLQSDNPDLQLFTSKDRDEKVIGELITVNKKERNVILKALKDHLDLTRKRFSKLDKQFHS